MFTEFYRVFFLDSLSDRRHVVSNIPGLFVSPSPFTPSTNKKKREPFLKKKKKRKKRRCCTCKRVPMRNRKMIEKKQQKMKPKQLFFLPSFTGFPFFVRCLAFLFRFLLILFVFFRVPLTVPFRPISTPRRE